MALAFEPQSLLRDLPQPWNAWVGQQPFIVQLGNWLALFGYDNFLIDSQCTSSVSLSVGLLIIWFGNIPAFCDTIKNVVELVVGRNILRLRIYWSHCNGRLS